MDSLAGCLAAFTVTPIMLTVDKAVVERIRGTKTLTQSILSTFKQMAFTPLKFIFSREFKWIFAVYGSTYLTANSLDSLCKIHRVSESTEIAAKLIGVTAINMTMSILKDRAFAYYFGTKT